MMDLNEMMDSICASKEEAASAIALAFANGDSKKAHSYYFEFFDVINKSKIFIFRNGGKALTKYDMKINGILKEVAFIIGEDVNKVRGKFINERNDDEIDNSSKPNLEGIKKIDCLRLKNDYYFSEDMFLKLGISFQKYIDIYRSKGIDKALELSSNVKKLKRIYKFYELKSAYSEKKDRKDFFPIMYKIPVMAEKYNIKSIEDIMNFYCEICSCLVDENSLGKNEKKHVECNKNSLISRVGNKGIINNRNELKRLKKTVEKMYENEFIKKSFFESNLNDFFIRNNISITKKNLEQVVYLIFSSYFTCAYNTRVKFDEGVFNISVFRDEVLQRGYLCQNEIIIHELIHSFEPYDGSARMYDKCCYLSETMTQYFTLQSLKYLNKNIVEGETIEGDGFSCSYNFMLPMLDVIRKSPLWNDFVYCKLTNDYSLLIDRIGDDAMKIAKTFDTVYKYRDMDIQLRSDKVDEACFFLKSTVNNIVKTNRKYNKK